ncbi:NAD(P)/FAD-dependent oxidoreductase [Amaricoccus macauensis]|uniref:NAD(P)/FAD-dependent oxidoreductase n=1 Tax=Amaricoccus macauensis TaxID=57001 RepID=UPI003C7B6843
MSESAVIVGAGQGGLQAAASLRQEGFDGTITLIGAEPGLPYQRPPLSKAYLKTGIADGLRLRPESFFVKNAISYFPDTEVEQIDRENRRVMAGDATFTYDHLILATGSRNLRPPIEGLDRAIDLRTLADAERLRAALDRPMRCAVIGGGFIGLEFAAVARGLGHDVVLAEAAPRLMARAVSPQMSERFLEKHMSLGCRIILNQAVTSVSEAAIHLADGSEHPANLVLLAAGIRPNTELAAAAGLSVANGIVTDATLRTADPAISALGDCAAFPDPRTGRMIRLESVQAATDHARTIARRIVHGSAEPYAAVPWFWSDQADWKLQIAGLAAPSDTSMAAEGDAILRFDDDILTAVETVNDPKRHMKARRLFAQTPAPTRGMLAEVDFDLARL